MYYGVSQSVSQSLTCHSAAALTPRPAQSPMDSPAKRPREEDGVPWQEIHLAIFGVKLSGRLPAPEKLLEKFRRFFDDPGNPSTPTEMIEAFKVERSQAIADEDFLKVTPLTEKIAALEAYPAVEEEDEDEDDDGEGAEGGQFGGGLICHSVACPHCGKDLSVSVTAHVAYDEEKVPE